MKIGDKVKLVSERYADTLWNPFWGGKHGFVKGKIVRINAPDEIFPVRVTWENGQSNSYEFSHLEPIYEPLSDLIDFINETLVI